jgi:hypothetical protein
MSEPHQAPAEPDQYLWDSFALAALQGLLANPYVMSQSLAPDDAPSLTLPGRIAETVRHYADAMMVVRNRRRKQP